MGMIQQMNEAFRTKYPILAESAADREKFERFAGKDLSDRFNKLKDSNRIKNDTENKKNYADYGYWENLPVAELEKFVSDLEHTHSSSEEKRIAKAGADKIYDADGWKVYKINTYDAAKYYGEDTTWCITGRYKGYEEEGQEYFDSYKRDGVKDYYFLIPDNDPYGKWCYLDRGVDLLSDDANHFYSSFFWSAKNSHHSIADVVDIIPQQVLSVLPNVAAAAAVWLAERQARRQAKEAGIYEYHNNHPHWIAQEIVAYNEKVHTLIISKDVVDIPSSAFFFGLMKQVIFENGSTLKTIGADAFRLCRELRSIKFPVSLTTIGEEAFSVCENLQSVRFERGSQLTEIQADTFEDCKRLKTVSFPESLTTIRRSAFRGCRALTEITLPRNVKWLSDTAFDESSVQTINVCGEYRPELFSGFQGNKEITINWVNAGYTETAAEARRNAFEYMKNKPMEEDLDLESPEQEFSSARTSINSAKLPAIFSMITLQPGTVNLDYGGGKFDNATEYLATKDVTNLVYDKYNRTGDHNAEVIDRIEENGGADTATCSNVLNVIKEEAVRQSVLRNIKKLLKDNGVAYFTVYEGNGTGEGKETSCGYQLNRKTSDYLYEIAEVFDSVTKKGRLIIATKNADDG